jgi:hypothetical protein
MRNRLSIPNLHRLDNGHNLIPWYNLTTTTMSDTDFFTPCRINDHLFSLAGGIIFLGETGLDDFNSFDFNDALQVQLQPNITT